MRLNNRLEEAYRIGQKLAFAKLADLGAADESQEGGPGDKMSPDEYANTRFYGSIPGNAAFPGLKRSIMGNDYDEYSAEYDKQLAAYNASKLPPVANDTLLSNPLGLSSLRAHGYHHQDLDMFASPIEAEMQQIEGQYEGEERQRRLEDLAERVYGNFAALPDDEIEALAQGRENLEHDLATGANRHDNSALQSSIAVRPIPLTPGGFYSEPAQITHVPLLHNPRRGKDHSYTANVPTDNELNPGFYSGNYHAHAAYGGIPAFDGMPDSVRRGPMVIPLDQERSPGTPDFIPSNKAEYDARVAAGHMPHPGGMTGDQVQLGAYPRPQGRNGEAVTRDRVEDPFTYAHEMYHHKVNNIGRSHPTLGRLRKYLRPGDNEMYADHYAAQAPRASDTDARFHSLLDTSHQFDMEKNPFFHDPKHPQQLTIGGTPMHHKPSVRMALPRVGPITGP